MSLAVAGFWLCVILVLYPWVAYPGLLWALVSVVRPRRIAAALPDGEPPSVTMIIAVHNEEAAIFAKLEDCLQLDYPQERFEIIVASDGSTDGTVHAAQTFARVRRNVRVIAEPGRAGKTATQNAAVQSAQGEILVFSDVDTRLDRRFLTCAIGAFADRHVGCVTGALVWTNTHQSGIAAGGDIYRRYEHLLWQLESRLGVLAWGSGACLCVRRDVFKPMESHYGEDCIVPLDVVAQGYRVLFKPDAIAYEMRIANPRAEMRARIRMTLRGFGGTLSRRQLLNPFRVPAIAWSIMSHKVLRWLTPYWLVIAFVCNVLLARLPLYALTLDVQLAFYAIACTGYILEKWGTELPGVSAVYAFCLMNLGVSIGVAKAVLGQRVFSYRSEG